MNTMQYAHKLYAMMKARNVQRGVATIYKIAFKACLKTAQAKAKELSLVKELVSLPAVKSVIVKPVAKEKIKDVVGAAVMITLFAAYAVIATMLGFNYIESHAHEFVSVAATKGYWITCVVFLIPFILGMIVTKGGRA